MKLGENSLSPEEYEETQMITKGSCFAFRSIELLNYYITRESLRTSTVVQCVESIY